MDVFVLKISIDNDLSSFSSIREALNNGEIKIISENDSFGIVRDVNGNCIGSWEIQ